MIRPHAAKEVMRPAVVVADQGMHLVHCPYTHRERHAELAHCTTGVCIHVPAPARSTFDAM